MQITLFATVGGKTMVNIETLTIDDVMSVYSGKEGKCCCGCSGIHRYNSKYASAGISGTEINDRQVSKVLNIIKNNVNSVVFYNGIVSLVINKHLYILYLKGEKVNAVVC